MELLKADGNGRAFFVQLNLSPLPPSVSKKEKLFVA